MAEVSDVDAALVTASRWLDDVPGVVGVGQGEAEGAPTIDVWMTPGHDPGQLPSQLLGVPVRVRDPGGPIEPQPG
ncbi:hypothetical protein CFP71_20750 [Amycolatopsis thailandensis]|uniref:Uncharacterized protein n=1 Tax=Amycolatopsis thailandensis TaxID=589330 RepID=A0A229S3Z6_9PSEU|nr:hypothetical protein [Amycolatopsis thailandensis]OXM53653.1 hypothetical protein CFP71_20750 [Amycolatopsis thailandensis]